MNELIQIVKRGEALNTLFHHAKQLNLAGLAAATNAVAGICGCKEFQGESYVGRFYIYTEIPTSENKYLRLLADEDIPTKTRPSHTCEESSKGETPMLTKFRIRELRRLRGMSQSCLAKRLGLRSASTVTMWERGNRKPPSDLLPQIARELNCTVDELFEEGGN